MGPMTPAEVAALRADIAALGNERAQEVYGGDAIRLLETLDQAQLPSYITAQVLDQWEASAIVDEARGTSWAVNPTTLLQILPVLRAALRLP